jgi:hypothetical protein
MKKRSLAPFVFVLVTLIALLFAPTVSLHAENTAHFFERQLGFLITAQGVPPNATADIDVISAGRILKSYRSLPLGIENPLTADVFPRYEQLEARVIIHYTDLTTGKPQQFVDEPMVLPVDPAKPATIVGIDYDLR